MFDLTQKRCAGIIRPCGLSILLLAIVIAIPFAGSRTAHADDCDFNEFQLPILRVYWQSSRHLREAGQGVAALLKAWDGLSEEECITSDQQGEIWDLASDAYADALLVVELAETGLAMVEALPPNCQVKIPDWIILATNRFTDRLERGVALTAMIDDVLDQLTDMPICPRNDE